MAKNKKNLFQSIAESKSRLNQSVVYQTAKEAATGKAAKQLAKAKLQEAKAKRALANKLPKTVGNIARGVATTVGTNATARAAAQTANSAAASAALAQWNAINNRKATPAEGTAAVEDDGTNTTGTLNPGVAGNEPRKAYRGY